MYCPCINIFRSSCIASNSIKQCLSLAAIIINYFRQDHENSRASSAYSYIRRQFRVFTYAHNNYQNTDIAVIIVQANCLINVPSDLIGFDQNGSYKTISLAYVRVDTHNPFELQQPVVDKLALFAHFRFPQMLLSLFALVAIIVFFTYEYFIKLQIVNISTQLLRTW